MKSKISSRKELNFIAPLAMRQMNILPFYSTLKVKIFR